MADSRVKVGKPRTVRMGGVAFCELQANSWDELLRIYRRSFSPKPESFQDKGAHPRQWVFRAEKRRTAGGANDIDCASCPDASASNCRDAIAFVTSLQKAFRAFGVNNADEKRKWEIDLVREFRRKAHHFEERVPDAEDALEWWALIQHYFGPTRLLDCSYSFFVACYFAVNELDCAKPAANEREKGEVWAFDADYITYEDYRTNKPENERIAQIVGSRDYEDCREKAQGRACDRFIEEDCVPRNRIVDLLMKKSKPCVYAVTPVRLNERLINQRGTFLLQGDITKCFVRNLKETIRNRLDSASHLYRIVISLSLSEKKRCLWELDHMGINQATLFPDLRGFAESLIRRLASRKRRVPR